MGPEPDVSAAAFIEELLNDVMLKPSGDLRVVADKYFSPQYRQRTDGEWLSRSEFLEHAAHLRSLLVEASVVIHQALRDGNQISSRHTVRATKQDGGQVESDVYLFGELDDQDRFLYIDELTRMVAGGEADRDLGRSRG